MVIIKLLLIAVIVTYCIETSGGWAGISSLAVRWITQGRQNRPLDLKPFSCARCMTFWTCAAYLIATGQLTIPTMAAACLASHLTHGIAQAFDIIDHILTKIYRYAIDQRTN